MAARWEWLLAEVFDAADDAPMSETDLGLLSGGAAFARLCESLAQDRGADEAALQAATLLKRWVGEGLIGR